MNRRFSLSVPILFTLSFTAVVVNAQTEPAAAEEDELEVPAAPAPGAEAAPSPRTGTVPGPAPSEAPAVKKAPETPAESGAATPAASASEATAPNAEPAKPAAVANGADSSAKATESSGSPKATGASTAPRSGFSHTNLERVAYGRPVPKELTLGGYLQAEYQHNAISEDQLGPGEVPLNYDRFLVRRGRLRLDRGWDYAAATLELDANTTRGVTVGIRRAEAALLYRGDNPDTAPPLVMLSVGVTDLPFGFELAESARVRPFMERSFASSALFPTEMDAGAKLSGAIAFVRYGVAITNGEPVENGGLPRDPNAAKDVSGRLGVDLDVSKSFGITGGSSFAVGEGFHPGSPATKDSLTWNDENEDGEFEDSELVPAPGRAEIKSENFERWAFGLDLGLKLKTSLGTSRLYGELYVASNYDRGFLPADPVSSGVDVREAGGYVALSQGITEYGLVGFRYGVYDPNSDLLETRVAKLVPKLQTVSTASILAGVVLPDRARLTFQYDLIKDYLARDQVGVPTNADNDQWTLRLQVEL
jgi:hypothetical protein